MRIRKTTLPLGIDFDYDDQNAKELDLVVGPFQQTLRELPCRGRALEALKGLLGSCDDLWRRWLVQG